MTCWLACFLHLTRGPCFPNHLWQVPFPLSYCFQLPPISFLRKKKAPPPAPLNASAGALGGQSCPWESARTGAGEGKSQPRATPAGVQHAVTARCRRLPERAYKWLYRYMAPTPNSSALSEEAFLSSLSSSIEKQNNESRIRQMPPRMDLKCQTVFFLPYSLLLKTDS